MTPALSDGSLRTITRIGGLLYVVIILSGLFGEMARESLVAAGDPLATLANIRASAGMWRGFMALNLFHLACSLPLALVFYVLLKPAGPRLIVLVLMFNVAAVVLEAGSKLFLMPALFALGNSPYLQSFTPDQLATLAYLGTRMHGHGFTISLIFFGFECILLGYLIVRSRYMPAAIGYFMALAGACYLLNAFLLLLAPAWVNVLILVPCLFAELSLALWLLFRGVDLPRWRAAAAE